ncbi:hypothetical protein E2C01_077986 [Portunus trituberculatus]|uniref:Uncharacterized protein n=1 Tax=Portunus trituberculatus TaxID=210409 RepID=A0A5B7IMQ7_PORTR|nr:hypothetical protein [Portunus trituberculatus]
MSSLLRHDCPVDQLSFPLYAAFAFSGTKGKSSRPAPPRAALGAASHNVLRINAIMLVLKASRASGANSGAGAEE